MSGVVVDTSAVLAMLFREASATEVYHLMVTSSPRLMSAATRVELGIVAEARLGPSGPDIVERFLRDTSVEIVALDAEAADPGSQRVAPIRQGTPPSGAESRRLLRLRHRRAARPAPAVHRRRLPRNRSSRAPARQRITRRPGSYLHRSRERQNPWSAPSVGL